MERLSFFLRGMSVVEVEGEGEGVSLLTMVEMRGAEQSIQVQGLENSLWKRLG